MWGEILEIDTKGNTPASAAWLPSSTAGGLAPDGEERIMVRSQGGIIALCRINLSSRCRHSTGAFAGRITKGEAWTR